MKEAFDYKSLKEIRRPVYDKVHKEMKLFKEDVFHSQYKKGILKIEHIDNFNKILDGL